MEDEIGERRERGEREGEDGDRDEGTEPRKAEQNCNKMTRLKLAINPQQKVSPFKSSNSSPTKL